MILLKPLFFVAAGAFLVGCSGGIVDPGDVLPGGQSSACEAGAGEAFVNCFATSGVYAGPGYFRFKPSPAVDYPVMFANGCSAGYLTDDPDALPDLVCAHPGMDRVRLYRNKGRMEFEDVTRASGLPVTDEQGKKIIPLGAAFGDLDADGLQDIIITVFPEELYRLALGSMLTEIPIVMPDAPPSRFHVYRNEGSGHFRDVTHEWGFDVQPRQFLS